MPETSGQVSRSVTKLPPIPPDAPKTTAFMLGPNDLSIRIEFGKSLGMVASPFSKVKWVAMQAGRLDPSNFIVRSAKVIGSKFNTGFR